jgi:CHAT domain-containing protein/Tfp pilus assembly protein PilF
MTRSSERLIALLVAVAFLFVGPARSANAAQAGVVVEEVSKGSAGEKAEIRVGDVLLAWQRPANPPTNPEKAEGSIESVFDWLWVEMEQGARGIVRVTGQRDGAETTFEVPVGNWGIDVRPRLEGEALEVYAEGRTAVGSKELERGMALWGTLGNSAGAANDVDLSCWMNLRIGDAWAEARRWKEAQTAYESARGMAERTVDVVAQTLVWDAIGRAFERQNRFQEAEEAYQSARAIRERAWGESLSVARSLHNLGVVAYARRDMATAEAHHQRALAIREKVAPDSLQVPMSLSNLGIVSWTRGDLATAEAYYARALAIQERLAPDSLNVAAYLNNLGNVSHSRGDLSTAEAYYRRALAIQVRRAPDSITLASLLNNLGLVSATRGDLATAEAYHRRARTIWEQQGPSLGLAGSLNNLGIVAHNRGDLATGEAYYKLALAIKETLAPNSLDVAISLNNLGNITRERGELATAEAYYKRALAIQERLAPDGITLASSLDNLGIVSATRGDLSRAEAYHKRALAIREKLAPDSLDVAHSLHALGVVARDRSDLTTSEAYHKRALAIREKLGHGSADEAESHHDLGLVYRTTAQIRLAADHFRRAIDALEAQAGRLGGSQETQSGFTAEFADYYRDYIDLLVEQNQPAEAFQILERSRARTLLAMLAERDLVFTTDVPEEIDRERKRIAWEYDRAQARLARLNPVEEAGQVESSLNRLRELRDNQAQLVEQIRQKSPRLASLQYPQPLDVKAVQAALDPGTLLLSYSVGKGKSYVFALTSDTGVQAFTLAVGETRLREDVERFRSLIQRAELGATDLTELVDRGRHLYELLMQPMAKIAERSRRVLVLPDGPLHVLPFAALVRGIEAKAAGTQRAWQYLLEWKPVHVVVSATVYAELRKARQTRTVKEPAKTLVAFGDPKYPASAASTDDNELDRQDAAVRSMLSRGYRLTPLPATKGEVAAIAKLYREMADTYVGEAATEERAKGVARETTYLHFATHGLVDERFPLNSGLALTIPTEVKEGQDNGILQAWEIFERMRIDAELVVLSACETGLGKELGGEGLMGLTRAFQYAGARSVLASLWSVGDDSTADLMTRFYGYLKAGKTKDDALRTAQVDLIHTRGALSHPFHWAAFQLSGDWK